MYIGEFSTLTGTTPKTIRFYESIGLLPVPERKGKYRIYDQTYVETVKQIKRSQDLGFKLSELKALMKGVNIKYGLPANIIIQAIQSKRKELNAEIERIKKTDEQLTDLLNEIKKSSCHIDSVL